MTPEEFLVIDAALDWAKSIDACSCENTSEGKRLLDALATMEKAKEPRYMWFVVDKSTGWELVGWYDEADAITSSLHWSMETEVKRLQVWGTDHTWNSLVRRGKLYMSSNPGGGNCHIVLEDANMEDSHLWWCHGYCDAVADVAGSQIMAAMLDMTPDERADYVGAIS